MPKIIDNIETKIFETAFNLFAEKGYNQVSMQLVAQQVGIAVGTLYNYYPNKLELFLAVFKHHLRQTYLILNEVIEKEGNIKKFITVLYDEVMKIQGFSDEIIRSTILDNDQDRNNILRDDLIKAMNCILVKIRKKRGLTVSREVEKRTSRLLLLTIIDFVKEFPEQRQENITYISNLANRIIR